MRTLKSILQESFNKAEYEETVEDFRNKIGANNKYFDSTVDQIRQMLEGKIGPIIRSDLRLDSMFSGRRQYLYEFVEELITKGIVKLLKIGRIEYIVPFNYDELRGKKLSAIETYTNRDHVEMTDGSLVTFDSSISNGILSVVMRFDCVVYPVAKLGSDGLYTKMNINLQDIYNAVEDGISNDPEMSTYLEKLENKYDLKFNLAKKQLGKINRPVINVVYSETATDMAITPELDEIVKSISITGKPKMYDGKFDASWGTDEESVKLEDYNGQMDDPYKYAVSYCIPEFVYTTNGDPIDS